MSKLYRARSLLYRRQILQENIRWKALDEIYKIYSVHDFAPLRPQYFSNMFVKLFRNFRQMFAKIEKCSKTFAQGLMKFCRISQIFSKMLKNPELFNFLAKCTEFRQNFDRTLM